MAALLAGQGQTQVAKEYHLPVPTVARWAMEFRRAGNSLPIPTTDCVEIGDQLILLVKTSLETMRQMQEFFRDPSYLDKQTAADAAILYGVTTDKVVRLLEAATAAGPDDNPAV
jgi:hypothetical protein